MLKSNMVKSGDTVKVIDLGILCRVDYNQNGVISGLYVKDSNTSGYEEKLDLDRLGKLQKKDIIPSRLNSNYKNCSIYGVLCYDNVEGIDIISGYYPFCIYYKLYQNIDNNDLDNISFKAYDLKDNDTSYGVYQVQTKLEMMGFKTCYSFVISSSVSNSIIENRIESSSYPFISGYCIFNRLNESKYVPEPIRGGIVKTIRQDINNSGYILAFIYLDDFDVLTSYTNVIRFNLQKGSKVLYIQDSEGIIYSNTRNSNFKRVSNELTCSVCGSKILVPSQGYVSCPDPNCMSKRYSDYCRMTLALSMDTMSYIDFMKYVKSGSLGNLYDVFYLDEYKDNEYSCSLAAMLDFICPLTIRRTKDFFERFVQYSGSTESVLHYIQNPSEISRDMELDSMSIQNVSKWFEIPQNVLTIHTMLEVPNLKITDKEGKILQGVAHLFNNKNIYVEGEFRHGSYGYICSILESYGASIATTIDNRCSCVLVGYFTDPETDKQAHIASAYGIPVYSENDFFKQYGIDEDIKNNQ